MLHLWAPPLTEVLYYSAFNTINIQRNSVRFLPETATCTLYFCYYGNRYITSQWMFPHWSYIGPTASCQRPWARVHLLEERSPHALWRTIHWSRIPHSSVSRQRDSSRRSSCQTRTRPTWGDHQRLWQTPWGLEKQAQDWVGWPNRSVGEGHAVPGHPGWTVVLGNGGWGRTWEPEDPWSTECSHWETAAEMPGNYSNQTCSLLS